MPRRRSPSRSDSRRRSRSPRKSRKESRSRSRRGRGEGGKADEKLGKPLPEWGNIGIIQELKPAGIGFIRPHSGKVDDKDLFFHKSALKNSSFDALQIGDECTYDAVLDESKGKAAAKNIVLKNGNSGFRRGGREEAAKEELIEKHCRDYEQKRMDDLFARKDDRARRTREMFVDIQKQIDHKNLVKGVEDRAADLRQVEMWRDNTEAFHREELMKQQAKHTARKELDAELFDAMMRKAGTHKSTCPGDVDQDLLLNRPLVEKMAKSGFKKDRTVPMLEKAMALKAKQRRHLRPDGES